MGGFTLTGPRFIISKNMKNKNCLCLGMRKDINEQIENEFLYDTKITKKNFNKLFPDYKNYHITINNEDVYEYIIKCK